jgi:hypothetical protein
VLNAAPLFFAPWRGATCCVWMRAEPRAWTFAPNKRLVTAVTLGDRADTR